MKFARTLLGKQYIKRQRQWRKSGILSIITLRWRGVEKNKNRRSVYLHVLRGSAILYAAFPCFEMSFVLSLSGAALGRKGRERNSSLYLSCVRVREFVLCVI